MICSTINNSYRPGLRLFYFIPKHGSSFYRRSHAEAALATLMDIIKARKNVAAVKPRETGFDAIHDDGFRQEFYIREKTFYGEFDENYTDADDWEYFVAYREKLKKRLPEDPEFDEKKRMSVRQAYPLGTNPENAQMSCHICEKTMRGKEAVLFKSIDDGYEDVRLCRACYKKYRGMTP